MEWTKEEILDQVKKTNKLFVSSKFNRIAGFVPDLLNQICPIDPSAFGINLMGQSTPSTQVTDYNTLVNQNMDQITSVIQATYLQATYLQATDPQPT